MEVKGVEGRGRGRERGGRWEVERCVVEDSATKRVSVFCGRNGDEVM